MPEKTAKQTAGPDELVLPLLRIGDQMSNICFNLGQDRSIKECHRRSMRECQRQWDNARRQYESQTAKQQNAPGERPATGDTR